MVAHVDQIGEDPFGPYTKPLAGPGDRRPPASVCSRIVVTVDRNRRISDVSDMVHMAISTVAYE